MDLFTLFILLTLLLLCSAFFSGSETGLMSSSKPKLHALEEQGTPGIKRVRELVEQPSKLLSTILLGNNLVNIAASAIATTAFVAALGEEWGVLFATLMMTVLVLIFAEVLPKTVASRHPETFARIVAWPMSLLMWLLTPATWLIGQCSNLVLKFFGQDPNSGSGYSTHDVRGAIGMGLASGVLKKGEHRMLDSILHLDTVTVEDVMVPRKRMVSFDISLNAAELFEHIRQTPHSRLPMWEDEPDNIIGVLHVKDFYAAYGRNNSTDVDVRKLLKQPYFVPEMTSIQKQLLEFRRLRSHLALIVNEYGDLEGLVTLEDILEEIVGEIEDEHDRPNKRYVKLDDHTVNIDAFFPVRDANKEFGWNLPEEEDAVTLGGLMTEQLERIPQAGETLLIDKLMFKVLNHNQQAITRLEVRPATETELEQKED